MKNKIICLWAVIALCLFIGCVSYNHTQAVRNEIGVTVREVYIRDAGTTDWGNVRNVRARTDSDGRVIYRETSRGYEVAYWDRYNMNNATQIIFFQENSTSETPKSIKNKDIAMRDENGILYMKHDVPISFTTKQVPLFGQSTVISSSDPITFTIQDRLPMLFVINQTGHPVNLISPVQDSINNQDRTQFQPMEMNRSIDIVYRIGQAQYTEQVSLRDEDATVTLTKRPPYLTITNNVGATINFIFLRTPGSPTWVGGNIVTRNGVVHLATTAQTGDISGSIVNRDSMRIWLGNISIAGDTFDIRIDDVNGNSYVRSNVQVINDMNLTFTQSDRR